MKKTALASALLLSLFASGCEIIGVPKHMQVRAGTDPTYQDDNVRFRTTYYMRIIDVCSDAGNSDLGKAAKGGNVAGKVIADSLYRFRMTGKAGSLANHVYFESGTLHKDVIDPLSDRGQEVVFGDKPQVTVPATQAGAVIQADRMEVRKATIDELVVGKITSNGKTLDLNTLPSASPGDPCPQNTVLNRQFQLLGPHGYEAFDGDQRLVMALSSDAKPLIDALKRVHEYKEGRGLSKAYLNKEQLRLSTAQQTLLGHSLELSRANATMAKDPLGDVIKQFGE